LWLQAPQLETFEASDTQAPSHSVNPVAQPPFGFEHVPLKQNSPCGHA
jgi:hypothetical protein